MSAVFDHAVSALKKHSPFDALVRRHGKPDLRRGSNVFRALVRSVVYQQLSGKAAGTILSRLVVRLGGERAVTPENVRNLSVRDMRSVGLSAQKAAYLHDLAAKFADGTIRPRNIPSMQSAEVIEHLTQVKGIGVWTVHMFLIFTLNRLDVLPTGDLGIKKGFQIAYGLKRLPDHATMERIAKPWREHASIASWYLWRVADEAKKRPTVSPRKSARKK